MTQSRFWPVEHLKMTVRTSILWKINTHMMKKWAFMNSVSFWNDFYFCVIHREKLYFFQIDCLMTEDHKKFFWCQCQADYFKILNHTQNAYTIPINIYNGVLWKHHIQMTEVLKKFSWCQCQGWRHSLGDYLDS